MPALQAAADRRSISLTALFTLTLGLLLYEMTALTVALPAERVLHLSIAIPRVDLQQFSQPLIGDVNLVVGGSFVPAIPSISRPMVERLGPAILSAAPGVALLGIIRPSTPAGPAVTPGAPTTTERTGDARRAPYHDADGRGAGLARRR